MSSSITLKIVFFPSPVDEIEIVDPDQSDLNLKKNETS